MPYAPADIPRQQPAQPQISTEAAIRQKQKIAEAMMREGSSYEPVQHWTQGAARVAQALMGGYQSRQAELEGRQRETWEGQETERKAAASRSQGQADEAAKFKQRETLADQYGLSGAQRQQFILTNKYDTPNGTEAPSNVREWQYFQGLSPDQQRQYLTVKRAEKYLDLGNQYVQPNPVNPQENVRTIPKNLADTEAQKQLGDALGKQAASAPGDISSADEALDLLDSITKDQNLDAGTSVLSPIGNVIPKTPGYDFQNKVDQAKSGAFLTAIQQLRGMGALSNAEGDTATKAVTRINTATTKEAFLEATADYEKIILRGRRSAERLMRERERLLGGPTATPGSGPDFKSKYGLE